jgi:uncharacterized peroxidase-related enzyme
MRMTFIHTVPAHAATGVLQDLYAGDVTRLGYVANYTQALSLRPEAMLAWRQLIGTIRVAMPLRRYELATIAAASALGGAYCLLAHSAVLQKEFFTAEQVARIVRDYRQAGLAPDEVAVMAFAEKVARQAHGVTAHDIETLRAHGLADAEILDVALAAAARSFFTKLLDAVGAEPDAAYRHLPPEIRAALPRRAALAPGRADGVVPSE